MELRSVERQARPVPQCPSPLEEDVMLLFAFISAQRANRVLGLCRQCNADHELYENRPEWPFPTDRAIAAKWHAPPSLLPWEARGNNKNGKRLRKA